MKRQAVALALMGLLIYALCAGLFIYMPSAYEALLSWMGVNPFYFPLVECDFLFRAIDCARADIDPFINNVCDPLLRNFNYSPFRISFFEVLGAGSHWTSAFSIILALSFILAVSLLPWPRGSFGWAAIAMLSPSVVFGAERANI
jgi:hypothetical protein